MERTKTYRTTYQTISNCKYIYNIFYIILFKSFESFQRKPRPLLKLVKQIEKTSPMKLYPIQSSRLVIRSCFLIIYNFHPLVRWHHVQKIKVTSDLNLFENKDLMLAAIVAHFPCIMLCFTLCNVLKLFLITLVYSKHRYIYIYKTFLIVIN